MVASVHELASRAGVEACRGGNAVDAAVAAGFALAVVHPQAGNIGGGGFLLLRKANGETHFIDFREKAPAAAAENMYLEQGQRDSRDSARSDINPSAYPARSPAWYMRRRSTASSRWKE